MTLNVTKEVAKQITGLHSSGNKFFHVNCKETGQ